MLAEHEVPDAPAWPGQKKICLLELTRPHKEHFEPLGFCGFDIRFPAHISREVSGWIPDDVGGRVLFIGTRRHFHPAGVPLPLGPRRDAPLLIWMTHRKLRVLYQCTPTESWLLGKRLTLLARDALGSDAVEECSQASLTSLLVRWLEADPESVALLRQAEDKAEAVCATQWSFPWSQPPLNTLLTVPEAALHESRHDPAEFLTYLEEPIVMVPVRAIIQDRRWTPQEVSDAVLRDPKLGQLMMLGPYRTLPIHSQYRAVTILHAMAGAGWRRRLTMFRNRLGKLLGCQVAIGLVPREVVEAGCRQMEAVLGKLSGAYEVYDPPYPGARTTPLEPGRARWLRRQFMRAVALPAEENDLVRMQVGELYH